MSSSDEIEAQEISTVITAAEAAMKDGDAQRLIDRYTADVVMFDLAPPLGRRGDAARDVAGQLAWFGTFDGPVDLQVTELEIEVGGDLAWAHSLNRLSATPKGMDFAFEMWFRATYALRKTADGWRIAHEHTSTPFYMDGSLRAATDLKP
jgi:ketosteroid isomerase-like protein